jgi:GAF domain-containing protein
MPLVLDDLQADPRYKPVDVPLGSSLMVPLMAEGRTVGVLTADRKARGDFSPTEVATLMALADQVSVAVENARLFEEVRDLSEYLEQRVEERTAELGEALGSLRIERDRAGLLYRIASELVASLDIDRVLHQALAILSDAVHATRGSILLLDSNTGHLYYRAAIGSSRDALPPGGIRSTLNRDTGLIGWVLKKRQSANIPDVRQDERWLLREEDTTRALLAVPILAASGESLGAIFLHADAESAFDENDQRLVEAAAVQVGNALNNAELYRLIREQTERLGTRRRRADTLRDSRAGNRTSPGRDVGVVWTAGAGLAAAGTAVAENPRILRQRQVPGGETESGAAGGQRASLAGGLSGPRIFGDSFRLPRCHRRGRSRAREERLRLHRFP